MGKQAITAGAAQVRAYRLAAHHLARPLPAGAFAQAAGVCGVQNSPPGAFETALWNRVRPGAPAGMQMVAWIPLALAASATPWAWLPAEQAITPASFSCFDS